MNVRSQICLREVDVFDEAVTLPHCTSGRYGRAPPVRLVFTWHVTFLAQAIPPGAKINE